MTATPLTDRRQERREAKLANILAQAWTLARRDGLAAISLRDLADAVGLRQPSLYVYFASKLDLYDTMFADGYRRLLDHVRRDYPDDPRAALTEFVAECVRFSSDNLVEHQLLFQRTIPGFEPSETSFAIAVEFRDLAVERLNAAGVHEQSDIDIFSAIVSGLAHQQVANDPAGERWVRLAGQAVDLFLDGIERRPKSRKPQRRRR
jgi:AcrR family transcriptional regulator